jgi:Rod binding domain-containing protein
MQDIKLPIGRTMLESRRTPSADAVADAKTQEQKKKIAKDFESVLVSKVFDEMKNTVGDSELLEDETSKQVDDMFWMYLADDVSNKGGFGLWKQIYKQINKTPVAEPGAEMDLKL